MTQWGLDTLFNPAKRHMDEEKRRLQSTREEVGDTSGGKRIDLDSGKVTIRRTPADETEPAAAEPSDADGTNGAESTKASETSEPAAASRTRDGEPSAAAVRAARRRGREPR